MEQKWKGKKLTNTLKSEIERSMRANCDRTRVTKPGDFLSRDYWEDRVTITVDEEEKVLGVKMG